MRDIPHVIGLDAGCCNSDCNAVYTEWRVPREIALSTGRRTGVTALRIALGTLILVVILNPGGCASKEQRLPLLFYGLALGP